MGRIRKRLVILTAACITGAMVLFIAYWIITGSLETYVTVIAAGVLTLLLAGIMLLARRGRVRLAAGLLVGLMFVLVTADLSQYGLQSPSATSFIVPILLAAFTLGATAGTIVAGAAVLVVWGIGLGAMLGLPGLVAYDVSMLTFNAPYYTLIYILVTAITGYFVRNASPGE
jgi:hypothetical protein